MTKKSSSYLYKSISMTVFFITHLMLLSQCLRTGMKLKKLNMQLCKHLYVFFLLEIRSSLAEFRHTFYLVHSESNLCFWYLDLRVIATDLFLLWVSVIIIAHLSQKTRKSESHIAIGHMVQKSTSLERVWFIEGFPVGTDKKNHFICASKYV